MLAGCDSIEGGNLLVLFFSSESHPPSPLEHDNTAPGFEMGEFCIILASVCFTNKGKQDKDSLLLSFSLNAFIGNALSTEGLKARATESVCVFCVW